MKLAAAVFALICCTFIGKAQANLLVYDFTVTAMSGSLAGTTAAGSFGFDEALAPAGTNNDGQLLSFLNFTWNGVAYSTTNADTGRINRLADGDLSFVMFGTNCSSVCVLSAGIEGWVFRSGSLNDFSYVTGTEFGFGTSSLTQRIVQVPEPSSIALMGLGLAAGLGIARRRKLQKGS